jgi:hypothetical protein
LSFDAFEFQSKIETPSARRLKLAKAGSTASAQSRDVSVPGRKAALEALGGNF